jgi:hypoxanthine phosphoribosyltransferase
MTESSKIATEVVAGTSQNEAREDINDMGAPASPSLLALGIPRVRARSFAGDKVSSEFLTGRSLHHVRDEFFFDGRQDVTESVRDNWVLLLTDKEVQLTVRWVAHQINKRFVGQQIILTGILKGVFIFRRDLCRHLTIPYTCYFLEASSYNGQQQQDNTIMFSTKIKKSKFEGRKIVLLDELFDHGKTLFQVSQALAKELDRSQSDIFTCCLFSKDKKPAYPPPDLVGFDKFPDVWLVGYGLDDNGEKRGWPHVFGLPKAPGMEKSDADILFDKSARADQFLVEVRQKFRYKLTEVAATF